MKMMTLKEITDMTVWAKLKEARVRVIGNRAREIAKEAATPGISLSKAEKLLAEVVELRKEMAEANRYIAKVKKARAEFYAPASGAF